MLYEICAHFVYISLMASLATVATLICKVLFGRKLSPKAHLFIWIPVILRLLIPYVRPSKFSVYNYVPVDAFNLTSKETIQTQVSNFSNTFEINSAVLIWMIGAFLVFIVSLLSYFHFLRTLKCSSSDQNHLSAVSKKAAALTGLKKVPQTVICENRVSPMVFGGFKSKLLLPKGIADGLNDEQLLIVFVHEYTHLKQKDLLINLILFFINIIYWFNPVVWLMIKIIKRDCENVCDEKALKALSEDRKYLYGKTILDLSGYSGAFATGFIATPMASTKGAIANRLKTIYSFSKKKFGAIILPVCIMISVTLLTGSLAKEVQGAANIIAENVPPIVIASAPTPEATPQPAKGVSDTKSSKTPAHTNQSQIHPETQIPPQTPSADRTDAPQEGNPNVSIPTSTVSPSKAPTTQPPATENKPDKIYTYVSNTAGGTVTAALSNDKAQVSFSCITNSVEIRLVGISSCSESRITGYFTILQGGEIVVENVRGYASASSSGIGFSSIDGKHRYSFPLSTKTIE